MEMGGWNDADSMSLWHKFRQFDIESTSFRHLCACLTGFPLILCVLLLALQTLLGLWQGLRLICTQGRQGHQPPEFYRTLLPDGTPMGCVVHTIDTVASKPLGSQPAAKKQAFIFLKSIHKFVGINYCDGVVRKCVGAAASNVRVFSNWKIRATNEILWKLSLNPTIYLNPCKFP